MTIPRVSAPFIILCALICASGAHADDYAERGRAVAAQHGNAVVSAELVIELSMRMTGMPSEKTEEKSNVVGTVVHPEGWVLLTNGAVDPAAQFSSMLSMMPEGVSIDSRVTSARIRYADGTEADGQIVLRDGDMDLALLKPVTVPATPQPHIDFTGSAVPAMFDPAVVLHRLGRVARFELAGYTGRVEAVIERPRLLFVMSGNPGAPVFSLDGMPLGILAQRTYAGSAPSAFSDFEENTMSVIVPGADLVAFLEQGADATAPVEEAPTEEAATEEAPAVSPEAPAE